MLPGHPYDFFSSDGEIGMTFVYARLLKNKTKLGWVGVYDCKPLSHEASPT
jgi:hypothetical protein